MTDAYVTLDTLVQKLGELGIEAGTGVMVHSSLRSFGHVEGGAATIVDALMEVLTPSGTLLMPTFNHGAPFRAGGPGIYDPLATPTTNGAIPDDFWRRPGVVRSLNPTHPFAAWGKHSARYINEHHRTLTMGPASPLGLLHQDDGYVLLLGVDYTSNTFHHVVEMTSGAPCLGQRTEAYPVIVPDGQQVLGRTWSWRQGECPFTDNNRYADRMQNKHRIVTIGQCRAVLYRMQDCFAVVSEILAHGKDGYPPCSECPIRPRHVSQTLASDWDPVAGRLLPQSAALTY
jgi:aminoglycoside 3-N-acetyltransferase